MPSLIDRFTNLINRLRPAPPRTTSDEMLAARKKRQTGQEMVNQFKVGRSRREIVLDARRMYAEDSRTKGSIQALARDVVRGGFSLTVSGGSQASQAQAVAEATIERLNLHSRLNDWVRLTFRDGDTLLELSADEAADIVAATRKPTLEMHRNSNRIDRFDDPQRAYWWSDRLGGLPGQDAIWFADWQIVHARWDHDEGDRYGQPLFASGRKAWKRMDEGELDIAVRRKTRAGMRYSHRVEGQKEDVEQYIKLNKSVLDNPEEAIQDFFGNVDIKAIQGDARLSEIADVMHHIETWAVASPVPLTLIGYGKDLNRDILEQKLDQYHDAQEPITQWVEDDFVVPILEVAWLLQGIWPGGLTYEIRWGSKIKLTPELLARVGKAGAALRGADWPDEIINKLLVPLVPGLTENDLLAAIARQQARLPDEIGRMGAVV